MQVKGITIQFDLLDFIPPYTVTNYDLFILRGDSVIKRINEKSSKFSKELKSILNQAKKGDVLYIENIQAKYKKKLSYQINLNDIKLIIK